MARIIAGDIDPDENRFFDAWQRDHRQWQIERHPGHLTRADLDIEGDYECVSVLGSPLDRELIETAASHGCRVITNRSIGYDNVDLEAAKRCGITVTNVDYSPGSVAEFTLMLMLMLLRKIEPMRAHYRIQDFRTDGLDGRELSNLTVGIVGAGRIGGRLAELLSGFGTRVLAYDPLQRKELAGLVDYRPLPEVLAASDIITLHSLLDDSNVHLIDADALSQMKEGALLVNCARGPLLDTGALVAALQSGHLAGAALDVFEGEVDYYFQDCRTRTICHPYWSQLAAMRQVILTPHLAYFTLDAVEDMVCGSLRHMSNVLAGEPCDHIVSA